MTRNPAAWEYRRRQALRAGARAALVALFNHPVGWVAPVAFRVPPELPVITNDEFPINSPALITRLRDQLNVDTLLSLYFGGILSAEFLSAFPNAINYHPGLLPKNRGLGPIGFAIYEGEPSVGFSFHRMTSGIDEGPILLQGAVPVDPSIPLGALERQLHDQATETLPAVLDLVQAGAPGNPQTGQATYHSRADGRSLVNIEQPDELTHDELLRRLGAFGSLQITIDGVEWPVTGLVARRRHRLGFMTADGIELGVSHVAQLPPWLMRLRHLRRR